MTQDEFNLRVLHLLDRQATQIGELLAVVKTVVDRLAALEGKYLLHTAKHVSPVAISDDGHPYPKES